MRSGYDWLKSHVLTLEMLWASPPQPFGLGAIVPIAPLQSAQAMPGRITVQKGVMSLDNGIRGRSPVSAPPSTVMNRVTDRVRDRVRDRDMGRVRDRVRVRGLAIAAPTVFTGGGNWSSPGIR